MKKIFFRFTAVLAILLAASCSQLSQYGISESMMDGYLQKKVPPNSQYDLGGLASVNFALSDLKTLIGRDEPNKISLSGHAKLDVTSIIGSQSADMQVKIKALPYYDPAKGAIYLKEIELADYNLNSTQGSLNQAGIKAVLPYFNSALQLYFNNQPIYVLDPQNSAMEAAAQKLAQGIQVQRGQLSFSMTK